MGILAKYTMSRRPLLPAYQSKHRLSDVKMNG